MMKLTPARACAFAISVLAGALQPTGVGASASGKPPAAKDTKADAASLRMRYSISLIGLPIGTATVSATLGSGRYRIEANGRLTGLVGVIVNSKGAATAAGSLAADRVSPASFAASAATSNYALTIRMAMAKGIATGVEITPPYQSRPDRVPLSDADRRGIIDPLSAFIMTVPGTGQLIGAAACDRTMPMFDGGVRFDIILAYKGTRDVNSPGYSGPVAVCSARYHPIAGHRPERPATKFMIDNKEIEVWLAPIASTRYVVPYRISVMTMVGTTVIEANGIEIAADTKAAAVPH